MAAASATTPHSTAAAAAAVARPTLPHPTATAAKVHTVAAAAAATAVAIADTHKVFSDKKAPAAAVFEAPTAQTEARLAALEAKIAALKQTVLREEKTKPPARGKVAAKKSAEVDSKTMFTEIEKILGLLKGSILDLGDLIRDKDEQIAALQEDNEAALQQYSVEESS